MTSTQGCASMEIHDLSIRTKDSNDITSPLHTGLIENNTSQIQSEHQDESQTFTPRLDLLSLPNEVLSSIVECLSTTPPSQRNALSKPEHNLTFSIDRPLKRLSLTNSRLRTLVLPVLFRHARVDPYRLLLFTTFTIESDTARHITTVVAQLQGPCNHIHPAWWLLLLSHLPNLTTLTVLAAPHIFAELGQVSIETSHSWAFKFPYHAMSLTHDSTRTSLPMASSSSSTSTSTSTSTSASTTPNPSTAPTNLLTIHPWSDLHINESSFLPAYSTYEYFLKVPPSLLVSLLHRTQATHWMTNLLARDSPPIPAPPAFDVPPATEFFNHLRSFSYTAIFPFYNHVDEILKCVRRMKGLTRFFVKLCPEPESTVLQDELERNGGSAGRTEGRIDVNDPWNEFETSYTLIPHTIIYLTTDGSLEEFQTDDVKMIGIRDNLIEDIDRRLEALGCWSHVGDGIWKRDTSVSLLVGEGDGSHVVDTGREDAGRA